MIEYSTSSSDGTALVGRHWPVENPKAVMTLVHGFGEHCGRYGPMASYLNEQGIAVVALDLRGHGKSEGRRGVIRSYDNFRDDLDVLLTKTRDLYPDTPQVLYGHSMGGGIVLNHGSRQLDDLPIIASAPLITLTEPVPAALRLLVKALGKLIPKGAIGQPIDGTKISNLPKEQNIYLEDPLNHGKMGFHLAQGMVQNGEDLSQYAKNWDRPLLLMHSKADQLTGFQGSSGFASEAKQVSFHEFETSQHELHNDAPRAEVYTLMSTFILKHAS